MPKPMKADDQLLISIKKEIEAKGDKARAWVIAKVLKDTHNIDMDESTIRGRFIEMGTPLSGHIKNLIEGVNEAADKPEPIEAVPIQPAPEEKTQTSVVPEKTFQVPEDMKKYIPEAIEFENYLERDVDKRLALHYDLGKYPLTQGKQGTGKTFSHMYYAFKRKLPFFLFSCYEDFKLAKLFGDKTIINGSVMYQESIFVKATQCPSVCLFDEVNAISNANSFDFHAIMQNRELFIKDANDGKGKTYRLHPDCKIGFAQNPKSAKYIGANIKPSNFLGRCTYITYPEFKKSDLKKIIKKKFPKVVNADLDKFLDYYVACLDVIEKGGIPVDISIRQLINTIELWHHGMPLREAIEDGISSVMEAVSQPKSKEAFFRLAQSNWTELTNESYNNILIGFALRKEKNGRIL